MYKFGVIAALAALSASALAQSPIYGQCGGIGWCVLCATYEMLSEGQCRVQGGQHDVRQRKRMHCAERMYVSATSCYP